MRFHAFALSVSLLGLPALGFAQSDKEFSSVQFVNATSDTRLSVTVNDKVWYKTFLPGDQTSAGAAPFSSWRLRFDPGQESRMLNASYSAPKKSSSLAVVIGDFKMVPTAKQSEVKELRARVLFLSNQLDPKGKPHRVRLVNGVPDHAIVGKAMDGTEKTAAFGDVVEFDGLDTKSALQVIVGGKTFDLTFLFRPPLLGSTIAFYTQGGAIKYVCANEVVLREDGSIPFPEPEAENASGSHE